MKLYYVSGTCALSPHIALFESKLPFTAVPVDRATKKTPDGEDYMAVNPKGHVPALKLDDGNVLTEGAVIALYIADQNPDARLAPRPGTFERWREQEWLNFIASDVHKSFGPLFGTTLAEENKAPFRANLGKKFDYLETQLTSKKYLLGDDYSVADGYLFTVLRWSKAVHIDLSKWTHLHAYFERIHARPAVQEALKAEGLV